MTHSLTEWAAFLSLGVGGWAACASVLYLTYDADLADFDPQPAVHRAVESGRLDPLLIVVGPLLADVRTACRVFQRDVGLTLAALLILTIPTGSHS